MDMYVKQVLLIDMDGVLCDYNKRQKELQKEGWTESLFKHPTAFINLEPLEGAIEA